MEVFSYLLGKKSSGGSGKNIYETTYNASTSTFGNITANLTADDLANGAIKINYKIDGSNITNIFNIVFVAADSTYNDILLLSVYNLNTYNLGELIYTKETGSLEWNEV